MSKNLVGSGFKNNKNRQILEIKTETLLTDLFWGQEKLDFYCELAAKTEGGSPLDALFLRNGQLFKTICAVGIDYLERAAAEQDEFFYLLVLAYLFYPWDLFRWAEGYFEFGRTREGELENIISDINEKNSLKDVWEELLARILRQGSQLLGGEVVERENDCLANSFVGEKSFRDEEEKTSEKKILAQLVRTNEFVRTHWGGLKINWPPSRRNEFRFDFSQELPPNLLRLKQKVDEIEKMANAIEQLLNRKDEILARAKSANFSKLPEEELIDESPLLGAAGEKTIVSKHGLDESAAKEKNAEENKLKRGQVIGKEQADEKQLKQKTGTIVWKFFPSN